MPPRGDGFRLYRRASFIVDAKRRRSSVVKSDANFASRFPFLLITELYRRREAAYFPSYRYAAFIADAKHRETLLEIRS